LQLEPADIFLTPGSGLVSRAIRFFSRRFGERRTKANHVGVVAAGGSFDEAVVVEALQQVAEHRLASRYGQTGTSQVAIYRPRRLAPAECAAVVTKARSYVGRDYGYLQLVGHFLDWFLQGAYVFRRLTGSDDYPICSWLVAHAYKAAGVHFGVEPGAAQPDDIHDFVERNPEQFARIQDFTRP
jgi:hypothetical protein